MTPGTFIWLLRQSLLSSLDDGTFGFAKAAAYSALLSFFPILTSAATILIQTRAEYVSSTLQSFLSQIVPPGTEDLVIQQFRIMGERPIGVFIVAALISLWAASGVIKSLMDGFQAAYRIPRSRGFLSQSSVAMLLVLSSAIPLVAASLLLIFGTQVERAVLNWLKVDPLFTPLAWAWHAICHVARYVLAFFTTVAVTAGLYYFAPNRKQRWRYLWRGSVLATLLWFFATLGFAWYVRNIARYNVMYGSIGGGIALLVWMYVIALITLFGCEFNAEYERSYSPSHK
jgi:membrane protein